MSKVVLMMAGGTGGHVFPQPVEAQLLLRGWPRLGHMPVRMLVLRLQSRHARRPERHAALSLLSDLSTLGG